MLFRKEGSFCRKYSTAMRKFDKIGYFIHFDPDRRFAEHVQISFSMRYSLKTIFKFDDFLNAARVPIIVKRGIEPNFDDLLGGMFGQQVA